MQHASRKAGLLHLMTEIVPCVLAHGSTCKHGVKYMSVILFDFDASDGSSDEFSMGKACSNPSVTPVQAPTNHCVYIISNENNNPPSVYVGYAADAQDRWKHRVEVLHDFGVPNAYGKQIKCAWCRPKISNVANPDPGNLGHWNFIPSAQLRGSHSAEHLLLRCVVNGVMGGGVVSTNTQMGLTAFNRNIKFGGLSSVWMYYGNKFNWVVGNSRSKAINNNMY